MTTTYSEDTDITNADPNASGLLPSSDAGSFDRLRVLAEAEIDRRIMRRFPPVSPSSLSDTTELTEAEVRFVLFFLYREAASRGDNDLLWLKMTHWQQQAEAEIASVQLSISGEDVASTRGSTMPIWRS